MREEASYTQGGSAVSALVPSIASVTRNMDSNVALALGTQHKIIAIVGQSNLLPSMSDTQSDTGSVFRVVQNVHAFAARDEKVGPSERFSQTSEPSSAIAA